LGSDYFSASDHGDGHRVNAWWYGPIVMVSCFPLSFCDLFQALRLKKEFPAELVHGGVSLMQSLCTMLISPVLLYLAEPTGHTLTECARVFHRGFLCLFGAGAPEDDEFCPNGSAQSIVQFATWSLAAISVHILTESVSQSISPLASRCCSLLGLLSAFICFQSGFPSVLIVDGADRFDEGLLLGALCSFVGSTMLLIDFNPSRNNTLIEWVQFDEIKHVESQLLTLHQQHQSLTASQSQIEIDDDGELQSGRGDERETPRRCRSRNEGFHQNYVCYLLMEQQKEMVEEEMASTMRRYQSVQRKRAESMDHPFLHELYTANIRQSAASIQRLERYRVLRRRSEHDLRD